MEDYIIANNTNTGKVRTINEDSMATFDSPNGRVVVVCDGMGGQNAGDVASQLAVTVIQDILSDNKFNTPEEAITKSIMAANQAILVRSAQDLSLSGMGSTCVMLIISEGKVYYGSVGDSRIYYIAEGMIRQLTKDQSYVQTLVDAGELTQEAAEHHQDKNQITNALGIEGMTPPVVCQMPITPTPGSVFLLCSDGLSGMVNNNAINQVISNTTLSLQDKAEELINLANGAGGIDNITVQLVEFPRTGGRRGNAHPAVGTASQPGKKSSKKRATIYWVVTIVCMILAIGGVTYWMIPKPDPQPVHSPSNKSESKEKNTIATKPSNKVQQTTATPQVAEPTQVKVIETKKPENSQKDKTKIKIEKKIEKAKENADNVQVEPEETTPILKTVNNIKEKESEE